MAAAAQTFTIQLNSSTAERTSENEERSIEGKPSSSADSAERGQWLYVRWLQE